MIYAGLVDSVRRRIRWIPYSEEDREAVLSALEKILASPSFCNSKRYPGFLRYVVGEALDGNVEQIKERTVGIEVFGRTPDYDTSADTVVRYTAGEVRKRLTVYYSTTSDDPVQIILSSRSYLPEFYRLVDEDDPAEHPPTSDAHDVLAPETQPVLGGRSVRWGWQITICLALVFVGALLDRGFRMRPATEAIDRLWSPILQAKGTVLICPGLLPFPTGIADQAAPTGAASQKPLPYLAFEDGLAMSRVSALLTKMSRDYQNVPSESVTLAQIRENPVVLLGGYDNAWSMRFLQPLRFHFAPAPDSAIVDVAHPGKRWVSDEKRFFGQSPDYGLIARFRNPSTDSFVMVVAGLNRYGTDAASQFIVSSRGLELLDQKIGTDWTNKNIEVVVRVDAVNGRTGAPIIQSVYTW